MGKERLINEINKGNTNISEIDVYEMELMTVEEDHIELIDKMKKKQIVRSILGTLIYGIFSEVFLVIGIGVLMVNDIKEVIIFALIFILFGLVFSFPLIKILKGFFKSGLKKCQYAHVSGKYKCRNGEHHSYYLGVIFDDTGKRFAEVNCTRREFSKVTVGERILVVSFDNEVAEACLLKI